MHTTDEMTLALVAASIAEADGFPNTAKALIELAMQMQQTTSFQAEMGSKAKCGTRLSNNYGKSLCTI